MKKIRRKKRLFIFIMLLIISSTTMTSYAYFNSKIGLDSIISANASKKELDIKNGKIDLDFKKGNEWSCQMYPDKLKIQPDGTFLYEVTDANDSPKIDYGPLTLSSGETNLTKNIDLSVNFNVDSQGGFVVEDEPADSFEVLVGDIDNFGKSSTESPYSGNLGSWHNMDVLPEAYDANGTDRRMVVSGFYKYIMGLSNNKTEKDLAIIWQNQSLIQTQFGKAGLQNQNDVGADRTWIQGYNGGNAYYCFKSNKAVTVDGQYFPVGYPVTFEGYTDRALRGGKNNKDEYYNFTSENRIYDGKNWIFLQAVEPLTFKYTVGKGKIESAVFQVYFDDLQSGDSINEYDKVCTLNISGNTVTGVSVWPTSTPFKLNRFVAESTSRYKAYIQIANSPDTKVEVPEISRVINSFNQSGPCGNMVTFSLPKRLLHYVKEASGLDNGLQLIIDDTRAGTSGDSYCIDFAKLTVNSSIYSENSINISGNVKDYGTGEIIKNCNGVVSASDGTTAKINADGSYSINVSSGIVYLTFKIDGFEETYKSFGNVTQNLTGQDIELTPFSQSNEIEVQLKIAQLESVDSFPTENITLTEEESKYINSKVKSWEEGKIITTIDYKPIEYGGVSVTSVHSDLAVKPNTDYEISYTVQFASQNSMNTYKTYESSFSSTVKAKATQENNPGWDEDGTGEEYKAQYIASETSENNNGGNNSNVNNDSNKKTNIYFETPIHVSGEDMCGENWWNDSPPNITYDGINLNSSKVSGVGSSWYLAQSDNFKNAAHIKVTDSTDANKNSKDLYYFVTKNVFICTNGYNASNSTLTINYIDSFGNPLLDAKTIPCKAGKAVIIKSEIIDGYRLSNPEAEREYTLGEGENKTITFRYNKLKNVSVKFMANGVQISPSSIFDASGNIVSKYNIKNNKCYLYGADGESFTINTSDFAQIKDKAGNYYSLIENQNNISGSYNDVPINGAEYTYNYQKCNVTIKYVDEKGTEISGTEHKYIANNETYTFVKKDINNYEFKEIKKGDEVQNGNSIVINGDVVITYIYSLKGTIVHYYNANSWNKVKVYAEKENKEKIFGDWPGNDDSIMKHEEGEWYTLTIKNNESAKVVFNDGIGANQEPSGENRYEVSGEVWIAFAKILTEKPKEITITYKNPNNWSSVKAYVYNNDNTIKPFGTFPGKEMTKNSDGSWSIKLPKVIDSSDNYRVIFVNGTNQNDKDPSGTNAPGYECSDGYSN